MYDINGSGTIDDAELVALLFDLGFRLGRKRRRDIAAELDSDGDGLIDLQELARWYGAIVEQEAERELRRSRGLGGMLRRLGAKLAPPPHIKLATAWLVMWSLFIAEAMLAVVYARSFGNDATRLMFLSWGIAEVQLLAIEEPLLIVVSVLLPSCFDRALDGTGALGAAISVGLTKVLGCFSSA
jgi:hypothetical protein